MGFMGFFKDSSKKDSGPKPPEVPSRISSLGPKEAANSVPNTPTIDPGARTAGFSDNVRNSACFSNAPVDPVSHHAMRAYTVQSAVSNAELTQLGSGVSPRPCCAPAKKGANDGGAFPKTTNDWLALAKSSSNKGRA